MKEIFNTAKLTSNFIIVFIIFICLFPTFRLLVFGSHESHNTMEIVSSILPELIILLLFIYILLTWFIGGKSSPKGCLYDYYFILFIVTNVLLGSYLAGDFKIALYGFRTTYLSMFFYFVGRSYIGSDERISTTLTKNIFKWFVAFSLAGLVLHFVFGDVEKHMIELSGHEQTKYFVARMTSLLWTPVLFGTLMGISALYFSYKILSSSTKTNYLYFLIVFICLFLTISRGPIIGFIIGFIVLSVIFRKWNLSGLLLLIMVGTSSLISLILTGNLKLSIWIFTSTADTMTMMEGVTRVNRWQASLNDFIKKPWGYGLGKAGETAFRFFKETPSSAAVYSTDGWFMKIACETGIYGLVSYILICSIYFFKCINYIKLNSSTFISFGFALFLMINAQNIVANTLDFHPYIGIYWLMIGFSINKMQTA